MSHTNSNSTVSARDSTSSSAEHVEHQHARLLLVGANGPTGRQTVRQALERGYRGAALTRHPETFPIQHPELEIIVGDATDPAVIDAAVASTDAAICTIGASFTLQPVQVYSASTRLLIEAMARHGRKRLLVVTSSGVNTTHRRDGIANKVSYVVMRRFFGRTIYDDMVQMERLVSASDLDWTIVRPPGLTNEPGTGYAVADTEIDGALCAREDLAAMLLDQLDDQQYIRKILAVATPGLKVSGYQMLRQEVLKR